jgi:hypothetical protein
MPAIWFGPESTASVFNVTIGGNPRYERGELSWGVQVLTGDQENRLPLRSGGTLEGIAGRLSFSVGDPYSVEARDGSNDPVVGSMEWANDADYPFVVSLSASLDYFFEVRRLAGEGALPSVLLQFKDGCGITLDGGWDNVAATLVPITEYTLHYEYSPEATG